MLRRQGCHRRFQGTALAGPALALIAILIALGGVTYAASSLPAGSVGAKQLRSAAVGAAKIRNRAVSARHLQSGSVVTRGLHNRAVTGAKLAGSSIRTRHLALPLGSVGERTDQAQPVVTTGHCGPWEGPGEPPPCPEDLPKVLASATINVDQRAFLEVSATVNLGTDGIYGHTDGSASAWLLVGVDGEVAAPRFELDLLHGETEAVPLQGYAEVGPGRHVIEVVANGQGYDYLDVDATSTVLTATVTPLL